MSQQQFTPLVSEADIILPPPTPLNPIPSVPAALRLDNQEQLLQLLHTSPVKSGNSSSDNSSDVVPPFRQLLVFGSDSLRTLLLKQVLNDPHTRTFKGTKKNWDPAGVFQFPKSLQRLIVGTRLLSGSSQDNTSAALNVTSEGAEVSLDIRSQVDVVTYFISPWNLQQTTSVAKTIRSTQRKKIHHRIIYLPQATALIHKLLQDLGMTQADNNISIANLQLDLFPLESDVISLEIPASLKEEVEGTPSTLIQTCARSILKLQDVVGKIPRIQSLGNLGEEVLKKFLNMSVDEYLASGSVEKEPGPVNGGDVAAMILVDRKVDMITPMVTPLTYEGLLDEVVGIDCGFLKLDVSTINPEDEPSNKSSEEKKNAEEELVMLGINASDTLYAEVRDQHVEKFGSFLQNQAIALKESHANFTDKGTKKNLTEIHQFVKQIPIFTQNLRSLTNHIHLAELVKHTTEDYAFREQWQTERSMVEGETCYDMLEEWVCSGYPPFKFLRLLCLQSLCAGGIKSSRYDLLKSEVVQAYGYEFLLVLHDLEKVGLIRRRETFFDSSSFSTLRRSLVLINAEVDTVDPDDVSYVSSGYAPLTVRLVQSAVQGWSGKEDIIKEIQGGRVSDITQYYPPQDFQTASKRPPSGSLGDLAKKTVGAKKPTLIVFYLGGVTYMEIAALRFLSKRKTFPYHLIIITTKVLNGSNLLRTLG
jgi:vacuolar protein sorting-associated protein 33A